MDKPNEQVTVTHEDVEAADMILGLSDRQWVEAFVARHRRAAERRGMEQAAEIADDHAKTWGVAHASPAIAIAAAIRAKIGEVG